MPTEADWEFAAMSRGANNYPFDLNVTDLSPYIWGWENSHEQPQAVAAKPANSIGLFDMYGNVFNLVQGKFAPTRASSVDPVGPISGDRQVMRGCSYEWSVGVSSGHSACTPARRPAKDVPEVGMRLMREQKVPGSICRSALVL